MTPLEKELLERKEEFQESGIRSQRTRTFLKRKWAPASGAKNSTGLGEETIGVTNTESGFKCCWLKSAVVGDFNYRHLFNPLGCEAKMR